MSNVYPFPYRTVAEVSISRLVRNLVSIRTFCAREVIPVIKANAYGHGLIPCARALALRGCVELLSVATLEEALEVRSKLSDVGILVLSSVFPHQVDAYLKFNIAMTIHSLNHLKALSGRKEVPPIHLKIDTGMNRLGLQLNEVGEAVRLLSHFPEKLAGVATHFAEGERVSSRFTENQMAIFEVAVRELASVTSTDARIHMSNSGGIMNMRWGSSNAVRAGLSLYGVNPNENISSVEVTPVMEWKTRVLSMRNVERGETIGYARTSRARSKMRLAILPIGYADGYMRLLSNAADVLIHGRRAKVVGIVSMDLTAVDVSHIPNCKEGTTVTLLGKNGKESVGAWELAKHAKTIPYEIFCGISARVSRLYFE